VKDQKIKEIAEKKTIKIERIDPKTGKILDDDTFIKESLTKIDPVKAKQEKQHRLKLAQLEEAESRKNRIAREN